MIRKTSIDAYKQIEAEGLLSKRRWQVYKALFHEGPLTASQIANNIPGFKSESVGFNVHARLCELRSMGVVDEIGEVDCPITSRRVIQWDVNDKLPLKFEKEIRHKCKYCDGKWYTVEQQAKFDI